MEVVEVVVIESRVFALFFRFLVDDPVTHW